MKRLARAVVAALLLLALTAAAALAHPLGNFTINHYAGIRIEPDRVRLDVVIDEAEIPTFQVTQRLDTDGDGRLSPGETSGFAVPGCTNVGNALRLSVDGAPAALTLVAAGVTFPDGNGGLQTMRLVCELESPALVTDATEVTLRDEFEPARIGWREMTALGSGVTVATPGVPSTSTSTRLTVYPTTLASAPDVRELVLRVRAGGPLVPYQAPADASPVDATVLDGTGAAAGGGAGSGATQPGDAGGAGAASNAPAPAQNAAVSGAAVPGGADALPDVLRRAPVDPILGLVSLLVAAALGAGHALTPGHGKTLMAAYLVGVKGTRRHALGLGLTVSVTHTLGILALAIVVLAAESALPADVVVRVAPVVAAGSIVVVGSWMLLGELRRRAALRASAKAHERAHAAAHAHGEAHDHAEAHAHAEAHDHAEAHGHADHHEPGDLHEHEHDHDHGDAHADPGADPAGMHSHGGVRHRHLPDGDAKLSWRSLAVLGLAGGLIPSANALLILLGTIAAGRPAWGVVLVAAFGVGMAGVMAGIGLLVVQARSMLDRASGPAPFAAARRLVPLAASLAVLAFGLVLSAEAIGAARLG